MTILLTGAAGFIGYHVAEALLARGERVVGVDELNAYYDIRLKHARLHRLADRPGFSFRQVDVADRAAIAQLAGDHPDISRIVHLAAQAGVRHSLQDPYAYVSANVMGHLTVLELARHLKRLDHMVYASSSSVYGANTSLPFAEGDRVDTPLSLYGSNPPGPFAEGDRVDTPLSLYAATKRADELMSHAYGHLFGLALTGLRFFTVYGPWGRPDMAYYLFARAIVAGEPITVFDEGKLRRDFTYIDDIVAGVIGSLDRPPPIDADGVRLRLLNIGNHRSETVADLIALLEAALGRRALIRSAPRPRADVADTCADIDAIAALTGFAPTTPLAVGIPKFARWFLEWQRAHEGGGVSAGPIRE